MKTSANNLRRATRALAVAMLAIAIAFLAVDQMWIGPQARQLVAARPPAEEAARHDTTAATSLTASLKGETAASLTRRRWQRVAGVAALVAAGLCITLAPQRNRKPIAPANIAASVVERRTATISPSLDESPATDSSAALATHAVDISKVAAIVQRTGSESRHLIPLLQAVDAEYHYLPPEALHQLPHLADVTAAQVAGVASFYGQFRTQPRGKHLIQVCVGTACHVAGADRVENELRRHFGIPAGTDTDPTGIATIETVGCLGCCTRAPVVCVDGHAAKVGVDDVKSIDLSHADEVHEPCEHYGTAQCNGTCAARDATPPLEIRVGLGSCCVAGGSRDVWETLQRELARERRTAEIKSVGCVGICHLTPMVEVRAAGSEPIVATRVTPADVRRILRNLPGRASWTTRLRDRLADWRSETTTTAEPSACIITPVADDRIARFVDPQVHIVTEHCGEMDPTSLIDYQLRGGFVALRRALALPPANVIDQISASGLRGRGGGGFPTARKWSLVAQQTHDTKYIVCNGDEGDPGAFMDRMVMESYPFRVLEGMIIAAHAVGATHGIVYVRHEYPLAVERLRHAIDTMTRAGLLGERIAGSKFALNIEIVEGAGAFVCGEETALLESVMGHRGTPRVRPPYPVEQGLWNCPTLVNNVETFANVPWIIREGADKFAALGTATSKGTKVFSLAGKVRRGGLIEIPLGTTIREVVENIGGGVAQGKSFKAVQIGGPSGGCVPAALADTRIDYESLRGIGAIMGSGGLVVLDSDDCMVDMARYFLEFTQRESCGHCTFCRLGTKRLLTLLEKLCTGKGQRRDLDEIESLCQSVTAGSLCGLGRTAPNPVLTTLRYFRDEYEAHLAGRCPAGRCKSLIWYEVNRDCIGCTLCAQHCPVGAIPATPYVQHVIDTSLCTRCDVCRTVCPERAVVVV